ncbi:hypothetical protein GCM10023339_61480 [Alloalcanivorax gelatiniphagus]
MAGGMTPGGRETLVQRVENTRADEASRRAEHGTAGFHGRRPADWADALAGKAEPASRPPDVKHCWYDGPHGRQAALLLGWRQLDGYYSGRIAVAAPEPDGWAIVEMWVEQGMLAPA